MIKCDNRAKAQCQFRKQCCGDNDVVYFPEGSGCEKFNQQVLATPLTNADRIRAMTDEEIAEYVCRNSINTLCDIICGGECNAISTLKRSGDWACKEIVMKWLQQTAGEEDKHEP